MTRQFCISGLAQRLFALADGPDGLSVRRRLSGAGLGNGDEILRYRSDMSHQQLDVGMPLDC
jgi:hypothetical protein